MTVSDRFRDFALISESAPLNAPSRVLIAPLALAPQPAITTSTPSVLGWATESSLEGQAQRALVGCLGDFKRHPAADIDLPDF